MLITNLRIAYKVKQILIINLHIARNVKQYIVVFMQLSVLCSFNNHNHHSTDHHQCLNNQ